MRKLLCGGTARLTQRALSLFRASRAPPQCADHRPQGVGRGARSLFSCGAGFARGGHRCGSVCRARACAPMRACCERLTLCNHPCARACLASSFLTFPADLSSLWNWNVHQVFAFLVAEVATPGFESEEPTRLAAPRARLFKPAPSRAARRMTVWDRVLQDSKSSKFSVASERLEYPVSDELFKLRGVRRARAGVLAARLRAHALVSRRRGRDSDALLRRPPHHGLDQASERERTVPIANSCRAIGALFVMPCDEGGSAVRTSRSGTLSLTSPQNHHGGGR